MSSGATRGGSACASPSTSTRPKSFSALRRASAQFATTLKPSPWARSALQVRMHPRSKSRGHPTTTEPVQSKKRGSLCRVRVRTRRGPEPSIGLPHPSSKPVLRRSMRRRSREREREKPRKCQEGDQSTLCCCRCTPPHRCRRACSRSGLRGCSRAHR